MACEEDFFRRLRERGLRLTPQREMMLSALHEIEGLATAEEIFSRVQARSAAVDISTVYRALELFQEFGLVAGVDGVDGQRRYELTTTHGRHMHLVCSHCGAVIGAELEPARVLADLLQEHYGFVLDLSQLSLPGLCDKCRRQYLPSSS
jgi:Fur family ferric uptake transcriptional regulator